MERVANPEVDQTYIVGIDFLRSLLAFLSHNHFPIEMCLSLKLSVNSSPQQLSFLSAVQSFMEMAVRVASGCKWPSSNAALPGMHETSLGKMEGKSRECNSLEQDKETK